MGDSLPPGAGEEQNYGRFIRPLLLQSLDVNHLSVLNNVVHDEVLRPAQRYNKDGVMVRYMNGRPGTYTLENLVFSGNLVVEHADFTEHDPDGYSANQGRSLEVNVGGGFADTVYIRNALFENERMPNHTPETSTIGGMSVGSVLLVDVNQAGLIQVENIVVRDCDDGGIMVDSDADNLIMRNIEIENVNRRGLCVEDWNAHQGVHELSNIWISNVHEQDMYLSYPYTWGYQHPIAVYGDGPLIRVSQVTVDSCSSTVFTLSEAEWTNCSITNTEYQFFYVPDEYCCDESWFYYSNVPQYIQGESLLINANPGFDTVLGPPWLAPGSPLIDAGDPAPAFQDIEDPTSLGWALYPSQGSLRSDIGYTGGPWAGRTSTDWVGVEKVKPAGSPVPGAFTLGEPYPNPFNPVVQVPVFLQHPASLELRVYSILGQLVDHQRRELQPAGDMTLRLDGSSWASGVYLVDVRTRQHRAVTKVMLLR